MCCSSYYCEPYAVSSDSGNWPVKTEFTVKDGISHQRRVFDWHSVHGRKRNLFVWEEPSWRRSRLHGSTRLSPHKRFNPPPEQRKTKCQQRRRKDWTCFQNTERSSVWATVFVKFWQHHFDLKCAQMHKNHLRSKVKKNTALLSLTTTYGFDRVLHVVISLHDSFILGSILWGLVKSLLQY